MTGPGTDRAVPDDPAGAFCRDNHIAVAGAPSGSLAGLTFGVKDIFDVAGSTTGFGNPTWLETHPPAEATAPAVQRLLDAGASMVGKTLSDEMAYSLTGENAHYGTPVNPADPGRVPGGSSNGSASAVAAGLVDFALGTDCGGSVRLPASYCGIFGIRPSLGRISVEGIVPFSASFDVVGWFARAAGPLSEVGDVLFDAPHALHKPERLLIADDAFGFVDEAVSAALRDAVRCAAGQVAGTEHITVSHDGLESWFDVFRVIQASEIWASHGPWITRHKPRLGPGIRERMEWASKVTADQVTPARRRHREIRSRLDALIGENDILCLPTSPRIAPLRQTPLDDVEIRFRHQAMNLLCISGLGGLPQLSLPLGVLEGMPLGLSLIARHGNDETLMAFANTMMEMSRVDPASNR
ncbi:MAG: amidase [Hyphomicrobiales bacterium]